MSFGVFLEKMELLDDSLKVFLNYLLLPKIIFSLSGNENLLDFACILEIHLEFIKNRFRWTDESFEAE